MNGARNYWFSYAFGQNPNIQSMKMQQINDGKLQKGEREFLFIIPIPERSGALRDFPARTGLPCTASFTPTK
jgi:hypothetical protein